MKQKTTIYMVRHCESEGNACRRSQTLFDGIVTRKGHEQAQVLAQRFADVPVTAVYSSDAYRSRVTAEPLAKLKGLPIQYRMMLREYTIGAWEGLSIGYAACRYPELYATWLEAPYAHNIPGADPFELIAQRAYVGIQRIAAENPGGTVVAITHSCTLTCALTKILGQPISYYKSIKSGDNTAVTKLEVDEEGNIEAVYINDDSHLPDYLLRKNYTGRSAATNFDFHRVSEACVSLEDILQMMCAEFPTYYVKEEIRSTIEKAQQQNECFAVAPTLPDRTCGLVIVRREDSLSADCGLLDMLYVVPDLRERGYCEQAMGEAIDLLRRAGFRYLAVKESDDPHIRLLLRRFCFTPMIDNPGYQCMRLTVPGLEGPVY